MKMLLFFWCNGGKSVVFEFLLECNAWNVGSWKKLWYLGVTVQHMLRYNDVHNVMDVSGGNTLFSCYRKEKQIVLSKLQRQP